MNTVALVVIGIIVFILIARWVDIKEKRDREKEDC